MRLVPTLGLLFVAHQALAVTLQDAEGAFATLQGWYNESIGLWIPSTGWWNSANCLTVIADLAKIDTTIKAQSQSIYANTFYKAQQYNLQSQKAIGPAPLHMPKTYYGNQWPYFPHGFHRPPYHVTNGFLSDSYDDEGWWALAWIASYDVTGNSLYLSTAESIFENMAEAYGTTPCGGLWWDKAHTYVNAIANELFLSIAASLANRVADKAEYYTGLALNEWNWFQASGMINAQHLINDGLTEDCKNNGYPVWSYNQGVILGGLVELSKATKNSSHIPIAIQIADAAIANLTDSNGILHDICEPNCAPDGTQFKGIFARNLQILQQASSQSRFVTFLQKNANSIWANDREHGNQLSVIWSGPFVAPANASTQSSALDAIIGALAVS